MLIIQKWGSRGPRGHGLPAAAETHGWRPRFPSPNQGERHATAMLERRSLHADNGAAAEPPVGTHAAVSPCTCIAVRRLRVIELHPQLLILLPQRVVDRAERGELALILPRTGVARHEGSGSLARAAWSPAQQHSMCSGAAHDAGAAPTPGPVRERCGHPRELTHPLASPRLPSRPRRAA
jgi:hypothetical protein